MVNSVITRVGGKYLLRDIICKHLLKTKIYAETFGGAAWILLYKDKTEVEIYNDADSQLYTFFKVIRDKPEELLYKIEVSMYSREMFCELKASMPTNDIDKAFRFYYMNQTCFGGKVKGQVFGYGKDRPPTFHKYEKLIQVAERFKNIIIENLPYLDFIERYDAKDTLFYNDPPYYGSENLYSIVFTDKDHVKLSEILKNIKGKFLLSYNDCKKIRGIYKDYHIMKVDSQESIEKLDGQARQIRHELLIANYDFEEVTMPLFTGTPDCFSVGNPKLEVSYE